VFITMRRLDTSAYQMSEKESHRIERMVNDVQEGILAGVEGSKNKHEYDAIVEHSEVIARKIVRMGYEIHRILHMDELPIQVRLKFTDPVKFKTTRATVGNMIWTDTESGEREGKVPLLIMLPSLNAIAKSIGTGKEQESWALLRESISHEYFHIYSYFYYPAAMEASRLANKKASQDIEGYHRDRGEVSAQLFAIHHLFNQPEDDSQQSLANRERATQLSKDLKFHLRKNGLRKTLEGLWRG